MKRILHIILFLSAIQSNAASDSLAIINKKVSFGYSKASNRKIDAIIVHSTFNNSGGEAYDINLVIKQFEKYKVSAHYVIGRDGKVYQLVNEEDNSFHAGKGSLPDGRTNINSCSIGIEIMTSYTESPTEKQITSLLQLIDKIKKKHSIKYILRHSDIAPVRKTDPWNMDWDSFKKQLENYNIKN
jgi:N-acetylmuramoyl-L-alanine amidase